MTVDPDRAAGTRSFEGRTFHLCSQSCIEKFDRDPGSYARRASEEETNANAYSGRRHGGCC
jgi:YHS domain-containing protein